MKTPSGGWTFLEPNAKVQAALGLVAPPLPVRTTHLAKFRNQSHFETDALVRELEEFLKSRPRDRAVYANVGATLAYVEGIQAGRSGDHTNARAWFERGLAVDPGNVALLANLSIALASEGAWTAAWEIAHEVSTTPGLNQNIVYAMFVGHLAIAVGRPAEGLRVLEPFASHASGDPTFWALYGALREDAAGPDSPAAAPHPRACKACGREAADGARFCSQCGTAL